MVARDRHAVTGWARLHWAGARWFDGLDASGAPRPVTLVISTFDLRPQPGIALSGEAVWPERQSEVDGVRVVDLLTAVAFEMRYASSVRAAARVLSMAAYDDLVSVEEVSAFLTPGQNGMNGVPQAREAVPFAVENAWSPAEIDLVATWVLDGGRPLPWCNRPVFDLGGRHLATPDVFDPVAGVAGEYEGGVHLERAARSKDVRREGVLRAHGIEVVTMVADDRRDPAAFLARLDDAYHRAARLPRTDRRWTVELPPWWTPTHTVDLRRALTPAQRTRFLRYRAS